MPLPESPEFCQSISSTIFKIFSTLSIIITIISSLLSFGYTVMMTDYGRFAREGRATNALKIEVMKGKKTRQAVLKRVRKQREIVVKRLTAKYGR
jgi:hypothetical protein